MSASIHEPAIHQFCTVVEILIAMFRQSLKRELARSQVPASPL